MKRFATMNRHRTTAVMNRLSLAAASKPQQQQLYSTKMTRAEIQEMYKQSIDFENGGAEAFWDKQAQSLTWFKKYDKVLGKLLIFDSDHDDDQ